MIKKITNYSIRLADKQFSFFNFKISLNEILTHQLFAGSFWMIFGNNFANFLAYIYHLVIGRMLGPGSYGELATVISIVGFLGVSFSFLNLSIVKFVSAAREKDVTKIVTWFFKRGVVIGLVFSIIILIFTPSLANFLHIDLINLVLLSPIFFVMLLGFVLASFLQGLMRFKQMAISNNLFMIARIFFGTLLIYFGFDVFGAVVGLFIASCVGFGVSKFFLRDIKLFAAVAKFSETGNVFKYTLPVLVTSFSNNFMLTLDLVLVKHFFSSHEAGIYASIATLGKVVFWAGVPVASVMFPIVSKKHSTGLSYNKVFLLSLLLTVAISTGVVVIYFFLPDLTVRMLYGERFLEAGKYLFLYGLYMAFFTIASFFINFYLSIGKTKITFFSFAAALIQGVGIWLYHGSIEEVIYVSIAAVSLLLSVLIIYFRYGFHTPVADKAQ